MGKKIWDIVVRELQTVEGRTTRASATPDGVKDIYKLQQWSDPEVQKYTITYVNKIGAKVVDFSLPIFTLFLRRKL